MQLPQDLKNYGRGIENAEDFWGALIGVIVASGVIGFVLGVLVR